MKPCSLLAFGKIYLLKYKLLPGNLGHLILLPSFHTIINGQFQNTTGLLASKVSTLSDTPC